MRGAPEPPIFVAVGSSLGDRHAQAAFAARRLAAAPGFRLVAASRLYDTPPAGGVATRRFLNGVLQLAAEPGQSPEALLETLLAVEADAGRSRFRRWEDRVLDLDLLLWGDLQRRTERLTLPHPALHVRWFVLRPLCDLAPELVHPTLGQTLATLLAALPAEDAGIPLPLAEHPEGWPSPAGA